MNDIQNGINRDEQQFLTKSEAALMIPIAFYLQKITYFNLSFHTANYHEDNKC